MTKAKKKVTKYKLTKAQTKFVLIFASIVAVFVIMIPVIVTLVEKNKGADKTFNVNVVSNVNDYNDGKLNIKPGTKFGEIKDLIRIPDGYAVLGYYQDLSMEKEYTDDYEITSDITINLALEFMFVTDNYTLESGDGSGTINHFYQIKGLYPKYISTKNIVIPKSYNGRSIVYIAENAFLNNESIVSVEMPNTILAIGRNAFLNCTNLTSVKLSSSINIIESSAFSNCKNLTSISIPSSAFRIEKSAFANCSNLKNIIIESETIYKNISDDYFREDTIPNSFIEQIKVLNSIDDGTNTYLNEEFTKTLDGDYNVYTKKPSTEG